MAQVSSAHAIEPHQNDNAQVKKIWKTFWLLLFLTIAELGLGLAVYTLNKGTHPNQGWILFFKGVVCILTLFKAFYIVSIFMHLGDEIKNLIMTIIVPLLLFVWFIIAFLWDGNAWKNLRNTDAGSKPNIENVKKENLQKSTSTPLKEGEKD